ncbi:ABC transporter ATP-binding protein [Kutzneria buriramensis]|uniref:Putative ABC transport system ATP-binding protein/macrolide transport system ATP-binding/permease protein n=1 Tax=Kutzneria buriramensis TaxID=1045776 RepID=A0A3E0I6R8_9PSEU|nr:ATP-binding cassette domain-containing protein [Kutzneria buriramensis]REH54226.1 putative ABC transport system ATP-binding protein/macrolide transport system ATP-binding/permease protein [Kutzneria buriramensis]
MADVLVAQGVGVDYPTPAGAVTAIDDVTVTVPDEGITVFAGPSGSGKSTLLRVLALVERPTRGVVELGGEAVSGRSHRQLRALRRQTIALMFQNPLENLLPELTAAQNVIAAAQSNGRRGAGRKADLDLLDVVGLKGMGDYRVPALSGGQQQRLALCCALAREPKVVLADEPTSQLDDTSAGLVLDSLKVLVDRGVPVAVASHDDRLVHLADRVVRMSSGRVA